MLKPRPALQHLTPYRPPVGGRQGLRLDFNESTSGGSPRVLERLRRLNQESLARYPEREPMEGEVARFLGLDAEQVLLCNGVDEAIHLLCGAYLDEGAEALIPVPSFGMYRVYAAATASTLVTVPCGDGFCFPAQELLNRLGARTRLILLANPNNPTGTVARRAELLRLLEAAPHAAVLVDEAYFEFYGETLVDEVGRRPNLFVARTFSKAYGLAGLRIGVLAGDAGQLALLRRSVSPYNVNGVALACLAEALGDQAYVHWYVQQVIRSRAALQQELSRLRVKHWPSHANFVLAHVGEHHARFVDAMRSRGILVRDRSSDSGCEGCVRITVGTEEHLDQLVAALRDVVPQLTQNAGVRT